MSDFNTFVSIKLKNEVKNMKWINGYNTIRKVVTVETGFDWIDREYEIILKKQSLWSVMWTECTLFYKSIEFDIW